MKKIKFKIGIEEKIQLHEQTYFNSKYSECTAWTNKTKVQ